MEASTANYLGETPVLEEIVNIGGNIFEHDCERLPGITSGSKSFPADENVEAISGFSDVLHLVHRVPNAIGDLSDFFHLRLGSNRSVGVRLDAADVNNGSGAGEEMLELEAGEDARNTAGTNPVGKHLGTGSLRARHNNVVPTVGL